MRSLTQNALDAVLLAQSLIDHAQAHTPSEHLARSAEHLAEAKQALITARGGEEAE